MLHLPNMPYLRTKDPRLAETIEKLRIAIVSLVNQTGAAPGGTIAAPSVQSISVSASNGIFSASIVDKTAPHLGIRYFIEYATNPNFDNSRTRYLGPSRDIDGWNLGNLTYYFRGFSQYPGSDISNKVIYGGSTPIGVAGGGSAPPTPPASQGSGGGTGATGGFGPQPRQPARPFSD